ncbi:FAD-dependent oxidoreductase [Streptomyces prasinus]
MTDADVIVVGAGPVGLATALGLTRSGVRTLLIDRAPGPNTSPRAMAYSYPCLPGLEQLDVLADLEQVALKGSGCSYIDMESGETFDMDFSALQGLVPHPYLLQVGQGDVGAVLARHLLEAGGEIRWNTTLSSLDQTTDGVTMGVAAPDGPATLSARWVVGADGATSTTRELLGKEFVGMTWPKRFVSTNVRYDFTAHGLPQDANWRIDAEHGAIIARIDRSDLWRYTFQEDESLPLEDLEERIHEQFRHGLHGGDYELVQFAPYKMHQRCVDNFRDGRVLLAGDAAHVTNPCGGLGLTGGFMDAFVLYEALAAVVKGEVNDVVLDFYAARRREVYTGIVSPHASLIKSIIFDSPATPETKAAALAGLRAELGTHDDMVRFLLMQQGLATPSVLPQNQEAA